MAAVSYEKASKVAQDFIENWYKIKHYYEKLANEAGNLCEKALNAQNIHCNVTARPKEKESLEAKLKGRITAGVCMYENERAVQNDIHDLAGVRIVLYWPSDIKKVNEILHEEFEIRRSVEKIDEPTGGFDRKFRWYRAHHHIALLKPQDPKLLESLGNEAKVEIQVGSAFDHAFAEAEHNIGYKQLSGPLTPELHQVLENLGGVVQVGNNLLDQARQCIDQKKVLNNTPFKNIFQLGSCLSNVVEECSTDGQNEIGPLEPLEALRRLLKLRGADKPNGLRDIYGQLKSLPPEAKENIAKSYENIQPRTSVLILDYIVLQMGSTSYLNSIEHKPAREILAVVISTFIWLDELFSPFIEWQRKLLSKNYKSGTKIKSEDLIWLGRRDAQSLRSSQTIISTEEEERLRGIARWFSYHTERPIKLAFALSVRDPSLLRDLDKEWHLFERAYFRVYNTLWHTRNEQRPIRESRGFLSTLFSTLKLE